MSKTKTSVYRASIVTLLLWACAPTFALGQTNPTADTEAHRLTLDRLYSLPSLIGTAPGGFSWSADGRYLAFLWNDEGRNFRDVWMLDTDDPTSRPERVTRMPQLPVPSATIDDPLDAVAAEIRAEGDSGVESVSWHPDGRRMLMSFRGDLWIAEADRSLAEMGGSPRRLTETRPPESQAAYSPDGKLLAFLRDGDLWTLSTDDPTPTGIRRAELAEVRRTDLAGAGVRVASYSWAPDGSKIAILEVDRGDVKLRGIPDYLSDETRLINVRRAYPGEASGSQRLGVVSVAPGSDALAAVEWIDMGAEPADGGAPDMLLSYRWSPDGARLAVDTSDFFAKDRRIFVVEFGSGPRAARLVVREQDPLNETFYYWRVEWSSDSGRLYFLSDREEDYHVWAISRADIDSDAAGRPAPIRLTRGPWAVSSMHPVSGGLIVVGNRGRAEERHLFRVNDKGGDPDRISVRPGTHAPVISPDGRYAAVAFSSDTTPPELLLTALRPTDAGQRERRITQSPLPEFLEYDWAVPQYVSFSSHIDGSTLHGRLTLPPNFDPKRSYPAILGSVYTESVRNQWGGRTAHPTWGLDQYLAQEGYILLNVDMRGSWGRGRDHRRGIRLDYGGLDIEDLESGVRFLGTLGYVDMNRVGLWGSSYGGLMTAMSLFRKPGLYAAGVAGAPATSVWHALSGQMAVMLGPEDSPAEYADSSPFMHADGLKDPLMIIHGMKDRVVLFKDTVTLVQRLILLGKDVDLVALPDSGHGWDNENLAQTRFAYRKLVDFFNRHLGAPAR